MSCHKTFSWASEWCLKCFHSFCAIPASPFLLPVIPPVVLKMSSLDVSSCSYHKNTRKHILLVSEGETKAILPALRTIKAAQLPSPPLWKRVVLPPLGAREKQTLQLLFSEKCDDTEGRLNVSWGPLWHYLLVTWISHPIASVFNYLENHGTQHLRGRRDQSHLCHLSPRFSLTHFWGAYVSNFCSVRGAHSSQTQLNQLLLRFNRNLFLVLTKILIL